MRVLVACEFSGVVRDAFRASHHDAWSCDLLPTESDLGKYHFQEPVEDVLKRYPDWDLMIAHPPCIYLANSGVRHLYEHVISHTGKVERIAEELRWEAMRVAARFFNFLQSRSIPRIAIENPIPHKHARELIGNYTQLIQPWQFGHGETKATCLWLKNLPKLMPTDIVKGRDARIHKMPPSKDRSKERSRSFRGIAGAMAEQWGKT